MKYAVSHTPYIHANRLSQAIKYCAQSQLDTANATFVALGAIQDLAQSKSVTDADVLDLYEWAILDIRPFSPAQYAESLGTLRVRWVKANPKHPAAVQCLEACVRRWDLVSAQQVSVFRQRYIAL